MVPSVTARGIVNMTALAASLTRNRITSASSCGVTHFAKSALGMLARLAGVSMVEGSTALTVILPFPLGGERFGEPVHAGF